MTQNYSPEMEDNPFMDGEKSIQDVVSEYEEKLKTEVGEKGEEETESESENEPEKSEEESEKKSKYLGLFEDEVEALATIRYLSEKAARVNEIEQRQAEEVQRKESDAQINEFNRQATEHWKKLIEAGKGDEAFLFLQDHVLRQSMMMNQAMMRDELANIAKFHQGKQLFLQDSSVADVHDQVEHIAALIQQGWTEKAAVDFIRSIKGPAAKPSK